MTKIWSRIITSLLAGVAVASFVAPAGTAQAADPATDIHLCLHGQDPPSAVIETWSKPPRKYTLYCGSPVSYGVLHINEGHKIDGGQGSDPQSLLDCIAHIVRNGSDQEATNHNLIDRHVGSRIFSGHLIYEPGGRIVTVYTAGQNASSNNWRRCAQVV